MMLIRSALSPRAAGLVLFPRAAGATRSPCARLFSATPPPPDAHWAELLSQAEAGVPEAQCDAGWAYHQGLTEGAAGGGMGGMGGASPGGKNTKDIAKAIEWYEAAASQDYTPGNAACVCCGGDVVMLW